MDAGPEARARWRRDPPPPDQWPGVLAALARTGLGRLELEAWLGDLAAGHPGAGDPAFLRLLRDHAGLLGDAWGWPEETTFALVAPHDAPWVAAFQADQLRVMELPAGVELARVEVVSVPLAAAAAGEALVWAEAGAEGWVSVRRWSRGQGLALLGERSLPPGGAVLGVGARPPSLLVRGPEGVALHEVAGPRVAALGSRHRLLDFPGATRGAVAAGALVAVGDGPQGLRGPDGPVAGEARGMELALAPDGSRVVRLEVERAGDVLRAYRLDGEVLAELPLGHQYKLRPTWLGLDVLAIELSGKGQDLPELLAWDPRAGTRRPLETRAPPGAERGRLAIAGNRAGVVLQGPGWRRASGRPPRPGHPAPIVSLVACPDAPRLFSVDAVGTVRAWDLEGEVRPWPEPWASGPGNRGQRVTLLARPGGAAAAMRGATLWSLQPGGEAVELGVHPAPVPTWRTPPMVALAGGAEVLVAPLSGSLALWDLGTGERRWTRRGLELEGIHRLVPSEEPGVVLGLASRSLLRIACADGAVLEALPSPLLDSQALARGGGVLGTMTWALVRKDRIELVDLGELGRGAREVAAPGVTQVVPGPPGSGLLECAPDALRVRGLTGEILGQVEPARPTKIATMLQDGRVAWAEGGRLRVASPRRP